MNQPGQINPDTPFGKFLMNVASDPQYQTFLDIGTWNGAGTTLCLVRGAGDRPDTRIFSLETNTKMLNIAREFWKPLPACLELNWGKMSHQMMTPFQIQSHPKFMEIKEHYNLYHEQDVIDAARAPIYVPPRSIDVAVLDGGEFSGQGDFEAVLRLNPKIIALDDVKTMKNDVAYHTLVTSPRWQLLCRGYDRNGWAIFKRITEPARTDYTQYCEIDNLR